MKTSLTRTLLGAGVALCAVAGFGFGIAVDQLVPETRAADWLGLAGAFLGAAVTVAGSFVVVQFQTNARERELARAVQKALSELWQAASILIREAGADAHAADDFAVMRASTTIQSRLDLLHALRTSPGFHTTRLLLAYGEVREFDRAYLDVVGEAVTRMISRDFDRAAAADRVAQVGRHLYMAAIHARDQLDGEAV